MEPSATVKYDKDNAICRVCVTGTVKNRNDVRKLFGPVKLLLEEHGCTRVLLDVRGADIVAKTLEVFETQAKPEFWGWKKQYKAAMVHSRLTKDEQFIETVGVNRGMNIKAFDDINAAISWLSEG